MATRKKTATKRPRAAKAATKGSRTASPKVSKKRSAKPSAKPSPKSAKPSPLAALSVDQRVALALTELRKLATAKDRDSLARYGITATDPIGVSVANIHTVAKRLGRDHELALALWDATTHYEARMLCAFIDEPEKVTPVQMDRWCLDFDNWGICDTLCFHLFDRTPHAFAKVKKWSASKSEFVRRAGFALLASLAGHDRTSPDGDFLAGLKLVDEHADDERNFVKKGVSWALRRIGTRSPALRKASIALAKQLAASDDKTRRWIGKDALRDFAK